MPGWHVDDEALEFSLGHPFEGVGHAGVVPPSDEGRPHFLDEGEEFLRAEGF